MLVLTRKYQEKIRIGDNITVTVLRTKGKAVRLGIEAPADVSVIRGELIFDEPHSEAATGSMGEAAAANGTNAAMPKRARAGKPVRTWVAESPHNAEGARKLPAAAQVDLKRIPRGEVAKILPGLVLPGAAPLRAMMGQR